MSRMSPMSPMGKRRHRDPAATPPVAFDAFISYSHAADGKLAPSLQEGVQRLGKPWYRRRALRVFRDDTGLSVTPALWESIRGALDQSRWFVLMMSPGAAQSEWVGREVEHWLTIRSERQILPILTAGEWAWDDAANDFDWDHSSAVPPALAHVFEAEPRVLDLRWAATEAQVDLRQGRFRDAVAEVAAPIHGTDKDELVGEDIRQHRRALRLAWSAVALLVVLLVAASAAGLVAVDQRDEARRQRDVAASRQVATQADLQRSQRLDRSMLLSLAALELTDTVEARGALLRSVQQTPELVGLAYGTDELTGALARSRDRRTIAVGDGDAIRLSGFDRPSRDAQILRRGNGRSERGSVVSAAFTSDGSGLVSVDDEGVVVVWDVASSEPRATFETGASPVQAAQVSESGERVAVVTPTSATVWDVAARRAVGSVQADDDDGFASVAFGADDVMAVGSSLGRIQLLDRALEPLGPPLTLAIGDYSQNVGVLAFDRDATLLASSGGGQGVITIWDVRARQPLGAVIHASEQTDRVRALAFSDDASVLASGSAEGSIAVWSLRDLSEGQDPTRLATLPGHGAVSSLGFGRDGTALVSTSTDGVLARWDLARQTRMGRGILGGASDFVGSLAFSPDGARLATVSLDGVQLWSDLDGEPRSTQLSSAVPDDVAFSPDGRTLAWVRDDGAVALWDVEASKSHVEHVAPEGETVTALAFSPDGRLLGSGTAEGTVRLWDLDRREPSRRPFDGHGGTVTSLAFSPDGGTLASTGEDGALVLWDPDDGGHRRVAREGREPLTSVAFSPTGDSIAFATLDGTTVVWDVARRRPRHELVGDPGESVTAVAFSPDGRTLATAADRVNLWDVQSGSMLGAPLPGTRDFVAAVAFSPDGQTLAWGSYSLEPTDDLLVLWPTSVAAWERAACALVHRDLSDDERARYIGIDRAPRATCA
jgi:WD40 repeat protein